MTDNEMKEVGEIIKIAMQGNEKCNACEFETQCFFAHVCLSSDYKFCIDKEKFKRGRMLDRLSKNPIEQGAKTAELPTQEKTEEQREALKQYLESMTIQLEIPKEFVCDYTRDRFEEFFGRVFADIEQTGILCGRYECETIEMMKAAFNESAIVNKVK